jgi:hypothetical protein
MDKSYKLPDAQRCKTRDICTSNDAEISMNRLIGVLVIGFLLASSAIADQNDFRCFKSIGLKNTLRIQFVFQSDNDDVGYVIYKGGSARIPVKRLKEKELKRVPGGRPSEFETQWREITSDETGGTYVYVSQGALIDNFRYIRKDGKIFKFIEDLDASTDNEAYRGRI